MTNIEKMYKLAEIEPNEVYPPQDEMFGTREDMIEFFTDVYPPFTATKQLDIIKWLASTAWYSDIGFRFKNFLDSCEHKDSSQALAGFVCELWEDLSDELREEIRKILE